MGEFWTISLMLVLISYVLRIYRYSSSSSSGSGSCSMCVGTNENFKGGVGEVRRNYAVSRWFASESGREKLEKMLHDVIWGFLKWGIPKSPWVSICFNTKSWSSMTWMIWGPPTYDDFLLSRSIYHGFPHICSWFSYDVPMIFP